MGKFRWRVNAIFFSNSLMKPLDWVHSPTDAASLNRHAMFSRLAALMPPNNSNNEQRKQTKEMRESLEEWKNNCWHHSANQLCVIKLRRHFCDKEYMVDSKLPLPESVISDCKSESPRLPPSSHFFLSLFIHRNRKLNRFFWGFICLLWIFGKENNYAVRTVSCYSRLTWPSSWIIVKSLTRRKSD